MKVRREAAQTGVVTRRATKGSAGLLDGMSRSPAKRNAVDMSGSDAAAEPSRIMPVGFQRMDIRQIPLRFYDF
jgi:hypothetical protein